MLETYNFKQRLETSRLELSHTLYQLDAACRVIARVTAERDAARRDLEALKQQIGLGGSFTRTDGEPVQGLDNDIRNLLTSTSQTLSSERKTREPSPSLVSANSLSGYKQTGNYPPHKASIPGILCLDIHPKQQNLTLTGGADRNAIIFDRSTEKKVSTLVGHTKEVTCNRFHTVQDLLITGSADTTIRLWTPAPPNEGDPPSHVSYKTSHIITRHKAEVVQISLHATHEFIVSASRDFTWAFHSIETGKTLLQMVEPDNSPLTSSMLHPDGLILATGTDSNLIRIWDLKSQKNVATFQGHKGAITDLRFSENGYYLATAAADNQLKLWDLRGPKNIHSLKLDVPAKKLDYDYSGKYLAAATGNEIRVFTGKHLDHVVTLDGHSAEVTDIKFGHDALFIASTSMDRTLRFWG
jgi:pre-mRNA-processing factor 19